MESIEFQLYAVGGYLSLSRAKVIVQNVVV